MESGYGGLYLFFLLRKVLFFPTYYTDDDKTVKGNLA